MKKALYAALAAIFLLVSFNAAQAGENIWTSGTGLYATGLGNRVINSLAVTSDNANIHAGTGSGTVFDYTIKAAPTATTNAATGVTSSAATMNATVNANNVDTTITFEYGLTTSYGSTATASPSSATGTADTSVTASLSGLTTGATYHYRVKAVNSLGTTYGSDVSFTSLSVYTLALSSTGTGSGTVSGSGSYDAGTAVQITATPSTGSTFTGWSGDCSGTANPLTVTMTSSKTCTATFTLNQYALTVNKSGTGSGEVTGAGTYNYGATATVTATPATGSSFTGWSGDCSGAAASTTVSITGEKNCTATFTLIQFTISVNKSGTGNGTVTSSPSGISCGAACSAVFNEAAVVSLEAVAGSGSTFAGWSGDCSGNGLSCSLTMDSAKSVAATFTNNVDFSGTPASGSVPLSVSFTDLSINNPTSWAWDFGDGGTSYEQNPTHIYTSEGSYTVTLTAYGHSGSSSVTKTGYISVGACGNYHYRIYGTARNFASMQAAYDSMGGDYMQGAGPVQIHGIGMTGDVSMNRNKSVTLKGGYDCDFADNSGHTTVNGTITISRGRAILDNIIIR